MFHKSKRGQASVVDFVVAFIIFVSVFLVNYYSWSNIEIKIRNTEEDHYFKTSVYSTVEYLLKKSGEPLNWEHNPGFPV